MRTLLFMACLAAGCEAGVVDLANAGAPRETDASERSFADAASADAAPSDAGGGRDAAEVRPDAASIEGEISAVPCEPGATWPEGYLTFGGPLAGHLTVHLIDVHRRRGHAGAEVVIERGGIEHRTTTDALGCARFEGPPLRGSVNLRTELDPAVDAVPRVAIVEGLDRAQVLMASARREDDARGLPPPPEPLRATLHGTVGGWEILPALSSTVARIGGNRVTVEPIVRRGPLGYDAWPAPTSRPGLPLRSNQAVVGYLPNFTRWHDVRDYSIEAYADRTVGVLAVSEAFVDGGGGGSYRVTHAGMARTDSLAPGSRAQVDVTLSASIEEWPQIEAPVRPPYILDSAPLIQELYLPEVDAYVRGWRLAPRGPLAGAQRIARATVRWDDAIASVRVRSTERSVQMPSYPERGVLRRRGAAIEVEIDDDPRLVSASIDVGGERSVHHFIGSRATRRIPVGAASGPIEISVEAVWLDDAADLWWHPMEAIEARAMIGWKQTLAGP